MFEKIATEYREKAYQNKHVAHCLAQINLSNAITIAAKSIDENGKINSHQRRIGRKKLEKYATVLLLNETKIKEAKSFDDLLKTIEGIKCEQIGSLAEYDTALRIGAWLGLHPDKIYLHAGTRIGVSHLLGESNIKGKKFIYLNELPEELLQYDLTASDFEDIFCNYKDSFDKGVFISKYRKGGC